MNFFLEKLIKFLCNYWPLSLCKILKKFLRQIQSYEDVPFLDPKSPICHKQISFGANHYYYFHLPIGPFHCAKLKKNSYRGSRVLKMYDIWTPNNPFSPNNFFGQLLILFACTYQPLSLCKILKKFFQWIQSYEVVPFLGPR